ncbi:exonuclease 1 [Lactuca sativa]|uniref:exonuclease 1 n=1 Tax=Lactuca sativa TaxID=4236 RepID=UPI000CD93430|nr:exonuclease 1 [Lactuca sativa]
MGIKDLLRFMKPYVEPVDIKKYAAKRVGIDAYSWLHNGAYSCSMELCLNMEGDKMSQYLNYYMHRINLLRHHNISPLLVFDGCNIPCKSLTEQDRHNKRKGNRDLVMAKLKEGNINAATEMFQRAISITPSMAHQLIEILKSENIEFVVAPYEADAQFAYSTLDVEEGGIAAVILEDSDLLACGCSSVVFKMDRYGNGEEIALDKVLGSVRRIPSFLDFDKELFAGMCGLAGCDFLPSVPGIGISKAYALVSKYRNLSRVLSMLKYEKGNQMPQEYFKSFKEACVVFHHARIYDADSKRLKHLTPIPESLVNELCNELDFLGHEMSSFQATAIAQGRLDLSTMKPFNAQLTKPSESLPHNLSFKQGISVMEQETKPKVNVEERRCLSDSSLKILISPLKKNILSGDDAIPAKRSSPIPNNNPFKRQKKTLMVNKEQSSVVTQVEVLRSTGVDCVSEQESG